MNNQFRIISFYKYIILEKIENLQKDLLQFCLSNKLRGKIYLATEGISGAIFGEHDSVVKFENYLKTFSHFADIIFKEDETDIIAFEKMHVRIKDELVNSKLKVDLTNTGKRLTPEELLNFYESKKDFVIIDARNSYESSIGHFKNAVQPKMISFREWEKIVENELHDFKDKTIVTYCTGGIRCEKASAYLVEQGFNDVYQLDGGIISFIKKYPDTVWEGGMFVFDNRKVVEPNTKDELKYTALCELCNSPTSYYINCHSLECDKLFVCCTTCKNKYEYCCSEACMKSEDKRSKICD